MSERRNLAIAVVASFVFGISGGALGAIALIAALRASGPPWPGAPGPGPRFAGRPPIERLMAEELDLTEAQRERIEVILDRARPRYAAVQESTRAEIERMLTPEQRERWRDLERRFRGPRGRGGRFGPRPGF